VKPRDSYLALAAKKEKPGRPRIRTAAYWRVYYRLKQRQWRTAQRRAKTGRKPEK